jgi:hypothetical protein
MMQPADRNGEPVADLTPHRPLLCKLDVVGICWGSSADQTRLGGYKSQMVAVALAHRFAGRNDALGVDLGRRWLARMAIRLIALRPNRGLSELARRCACAPPFSQAIAIAWFLALTDMIRRQLAQPVGASARAEGTSFFFLWYLSLVSCNRLNEAKIVQCGLVRRSPCDRDRDTHT